MLLSLLQLMQRFLIPSLLQTLDLITSSIIIKQDIFLLISDPSGGYVSNNDHRDANYMEESEEVRVKVEGSIFSF